MIDFLIFGNGEISRCMYSYLKNDSYRIFQDQTHIKLLTKSDISPLGSVQLMNGTHTVLGYSCYNEGAIPQTIENRWFMDRFKGLLVDKQYLKVEEWDHIKSQWSCERILAPERPLDGLGVFLPIGYKQCNSLRQEKFHVCKEGGLSPLTFIHNQSYISKDAYVGEGSIILEHVNVQTGVKLGKSCILWSSAHIGHGSEVEDFCFISTHSTVSGGCKIGHNTFIGVNVAMNENIEIGHSNILAPGSIITKSTKPYEVYLAGVNNKYHKRSDEI